MEKLMNVENKWSETIDASKVEGAMRAIEVEEVRCAMNRMKIGKASEPFIIIISFFKVDFYVTFYNYKKPINVNLSRKTEIQNGLHIH